MKLFIVLTCILALTVADKGKKPKDGKNSKNSICSKKLPVKPEDCCTGIPSFKQYFPGCAAQCNVKLPAANASAPSSGKQGKGEKGGKNSGMEQMFTCVMPCILKAANVLGPDGNITRALLNAALLKGTSADWTQIVPNVTSVCIANATTMMNANKTVDKSSEEKDSNKTHQGPCFNDMVMKCVFKNLYLSCPSKVLSTNSTCTDLTAQMTQCPSEHGKKGKHGGSDEQGEDSGKKGGKGTEKKSKKEQEKGKGNKNEKNGKKDNKGKGKSTQAPTQAPSTAQAMGK
ncbi:hypothetical protein ACKWTF_013618 [Chironomus riparius]